MSTSRKGCRIAAAILACALPIASMGCFGQFALTRKVYRFNRDLSHDRWVRWFGFLIMAFFPIYGAAGAIDLVFANSIEFWGGSNPFAAGERGTRYAIGPNGEPITVRTVEDGVLDVRLVDGGGVPRAFRVVRERDSLAAYEEGRLIARVDENGGRTRLLRFGPAEPAPAR